MSADRNPSRHFTAEEDAALLAREASYRILAERFGRTPQGMQGRHQLLLLRRRRAENAAKLDLAPVFARPDWFDEPPPEMLAMARPALASGSIKNGTSRR